MTGPCYTMTHVLFLCNGNLMVDGYYNVTLFSLSLPRGEGCAHFVLAFSEYWPRLRLHRGQPGKQSEADRGHIRTALQQYCSMEHNQLIKDVA